MRRVGAAPSRAYPKLGEGGDSIRSDHALADPPRGVNRRRRTRRAGPLVPPRRSLLKSGPRPPRAVGSGSFPRARPPGATGFSGARRVACRLPFTLSPAGAAIGRRPPPRPSRDRKASCPGGGPLAADSPALPLVRPARLRAPHQQRGDRAGPGGRVRLRPGRSRLRHQRLLRRLRAGPAAAGAGAGPPRPAPRAGGVAGRCRARA